MTTGVVHPTFAATLPYFPVECGAAFPKKGAVFGNPGIFEKISERS
ncbi:MAG: hypothetical protein ABSF63_11720 [Candidatus Bathyarchaeia archaeon]